MDGDLNFKINIENQQPQYGAATIDHNQGHSGVQYPNNFGSGQGGNSPFVDIRVEDPAPKSNVTVYTTGQVLPPQGQPQQQPQQNQSIPLCGFLSVEFYKPYFNVTTDDVKQRLLLTLNPTKPTFLEATKDAPDLYGPFWIYTTLVFVLAAAGNFSGYLAAKSNGKSYTYNFTFVPNAAMLIYGFGFGVPIVFTILLKLYGSNQARYINSICIYGYSLFVFIPAFLLSVIPSTGLQWLLMIAATVASTVFLLTNFDIELRKYQGNTRYILLFFIGCSQVILLLVFRLYFFGEIYSS